MQQFGVSPPVVTAKMLEYSRIRYFLLFAGTAYSWATLWWLLSSGWTARARDRIQRLIPNRYAALLPFLAVLSLALLLLRLPYNLLAGFILEHSYGLSQQSLGAWFADLAKGWMVGLVESSLLWAAALLIITRFPRRWFLLLWAFLVPMTAFMIFIYPLVVDPLFNKYSPMEPGPRRTSIGRLSAQAGLVGAPVFVVDKSKQTNKINAEVTGIGPSARIVIWDTTIERLPADQVLSVVAHELGHYALGHVFIGFGLIAAGSFVGLWLLQRLFPAFLRHLPASWGVRAPNDLTVIPALMLALSVLSFFGEPVENGISRLIEHQADQYGLQINGDRAAMARAFVSLSEQNLSDPDPPALIQFWFFSHPSLRERIDFSLGINGKDGT